MTKKFLKDLEEKTQKFIEKIESNQIIFKTKKERQDALLYQQGFLEALQQVLSFCE